MIRGVASAEAPASAAIRGDGVAKVLAERRAERVRLILMRLSVSVLALALVLLILWISPWLPIGMTFDDYRPGTVIALALGLFTAGYASLLAFVWAPHFKDEPPSEFLRVLFGSRRLIRGRQQFLHRLRAQCRRAQKDRRSAFSLVVLRLGEQTEAGNGWGQARETAAMLVRSAVRADDIVGDSGADEVWLLAQGAPKGATDSILQRLACAFNDGAEPPVSDALLPSALGAATFGPDGQDEKTLLASARRSPAPRTAWHGDVNAP